MTDLTFPQLQYVLLSWTSVFLAIIGAIIVFREYRKTKARPLVYLELILIFLVPYSVCHGFIFLVGFEIDLMILLFRVQMLFMFLVVFFLVFFIESLRAVRPSSTILMLMGLGIGNGLILCINPSTVLFDLEIGPYLSDFSRIIFGIDLVGLAIVIAVQISRFIPYIPRHYLKPALLFYFGCLGTIVFPFILVITKLSLIILGIEILSIIIGTIVIIIAILIDERVLRIIPFNVYRLSIINMNIGLSIFDLLFQTKKAGPDTNLLIPHLITANFQFIQSVIEETERIVSIETDNYIFIFEAHKDIVVFAIADKASLLIKSTLKEFAKSFYKRYGIVIDSPDIGQYRDSNTLLDLYFSFLPPHKIISIG
ncbi:MAG: hypothetical protein KAT16_06550 [Candidatus Heimdallarchaeota archaeon]|nr:hypothetical protein [Candidatus Heimdallarchaeota archaeon]